MPRLNTGHSTSCCGAHSFSGFDATCDRNPDQINAVMVGAPVGRLGDITLNGDQVRRRGMMQRLADLGFVLDAHWINSVHRSDVYRFTRCDTRRPLLEGPIAGNWPGMVITQELTGDLPRIQQGRGAAAAFDRRGINRFQVGDRVRVNAGGRQGREFDIEATLQEAYDYKARMRDDRNGNAMFRISYNNLTLVQGVEQRNRPNAPAAPPPQRHENAQGVAGLAPLPAAAVAAPVPVAGAIAVGSRVRRIRANLQRVPLGTLGTVTRARADGWDVQWDNGNESMSYARNLELVEAPVVVAAPPPPPPAAPRIVGSTYHCVFRNGNRGAGYDTLADARAQLGRRTRIDRRDFMSEGDARWNENVPF